MRKLASLLLLMLSCATMSETARQRDTYKIQVINNNWLDAKVYIIEGTQQTRLSTITSNTTETFTRRWHTRQISFRIGLLGSRESYTVEPLQGIEPNDTIVLRIMNYLPHTMAVPQIN